MTRQRSYEIADEILMRVGVAGSLGLPLCNLRPWLAEAIGAASPEPLTPPEVADLRAIWRVAH